MDTELGDIELVEAVESPRVGKPRKETAEKGTMGMELVVVELWEAVDELNGKIMDVENPSVAPSCKVVVEKPRIGTLRKLGKETVAEGVEEDKKPKEAVDEVVEKLIEVEIPRVVPSDKVVVENPGFRRLGKDNVENDDWADGDDRRSNIEAEDEDEELG